MVCLLTHPDDIEYVLVRNASNFVKSRNYHVLKSVLGNGLLVSEGVCWQEQRRLAQRSFRHEKYRPIRKGDGRFDRANAQRMARREIR
jgi:cytochrome P450